MWRSNSSDLIAVVIVDRSSKVDPQSIRFNRFKSYLRRDTPDQFSAFREKLDIIISNLRL